MAIDFPETLDDLTAGIRGFCLANPEADFEMVMDYVEFQIVPFEADDALVDHAMAILLECDSNTQQWTEPLPDWDDWTA